MRGVFALTLAVGLASVVIACDGADRRDAGGVIQAVERFRRADNAAKPAIVEGLRTAPCAAADVRETRATCLAFAEATSRALVLKSEVEQGLTNVEKGVIPKDSGEARALGTKLDEAEALLKIGFDGLAPCDERILALKRKYRI